MDGCGRDQFWAVASISALNGLLITQTTQLGRFAPDWLLIGAAVFAAVYASYYIIHRHSCYYRYSREVAELLAGEELAPAWMREARNASDISTWLGSGFYVCWVVGSTVLGVLSTLTK